VKFASAPVRAMITLASAESLTANSILTSSGQSATARTWATIPSMAGPSPARGLLEARPGLDHGIRGPPSARDPRAMLILDLDENRWSLVGTELEQLAHSETAVRPLTASYWSGVSAPCSSSLRPTRRWWAEVLSVWLCLRPGSWRQNQSWSSKSLHRSCLSLIDPQGSAPLRAEGGRSTG
jgi:hypothetical protein